MKRSLTYLILFILNSTNLLSQTSTFNFGETATTFSQQQEILTKIDSFDVYSLTPILIKKALDSNVNLQDSIIINLGNKYQWNLVLEKFDIRSADFVSFTYTDEGTIMNDPGESITYKGYVNGDTSNIVRLVVTDNYIGGFIQEDTSIYRIAPLNQFVSAFQEQTTKQTTIIYNDQIENNIDICGTYRDYEYIDDEANFRHDCEPDQERYLEVSVDTDFEYFSYFFNALPNSMDLDDRIVLAEDNAIDYIIKTVMEVDAIYSAQLNMRVLLNSLFTYTTASDPYPDVQSDKMAWRWEHLRGHFNSNKQCFNRDVGVLFTGLTGTGSLGIADGPSSSPYHGLGAICGTKDDILISISTSLGNNNDPREYAYCVVRRDGGAETMAHELAHNLSITWHVCECTIMYDSDENNCDDGCHSISNRFSHGVENTLCNRLNEGKKPAIYGWLDNDFDACLVDPPPATLNPDFEIDYNFIEGPDLLCVGNIGEFEFLYQGASSHTWELGPGLILTNGTLSSKNISVEATGNATTFLKVNFEYNCENITFFHKLHAGIPLSPGTPITVISEYGNLDIGFWPTETAEYYNYQYFITDSNNSSNNYSYSGTTTDPTYIVSIGHGQCVEIIIVSVNQCGVSEPFSSNTGNSITLCRNNYSGFMGSDSGNDVIGESRIHNAEKEETTMNDYINVFPNPAHNKLKITYSGGIKKLKIMDISGRGVYETDALEKEISIASWGAGIYFIQLLNQEDKMIYTKLIIVK